MSFPSRLHVLLARHRGPALADEGADPHAVAVAVPEATTAPRLAGHLAAYDEDPDDLRAQRWAVVLPDVPDARARYDALAPLVELRAAQQGAAVCPPYVVPPDADPLAWRRDVYLDEKVGGSIRPRYLLALGDLDELPAAWQQALVGDAFVGRLAFDALEDYAAYAAKVVAVESATRRLAHALIYTAHDGTQATFTGYHALAKPCLRAVRKAHDDAVWPLADVQEIGAPGNLAADALRDAAASDGPAVLLSVSHGIGAPLGGWRSGAEQRASQGALRFSENDRLEPDTVRAAAFLPGGFWLFMACFSAGTPPTSAYARWLQALPSAEADLQEALVSLPVQGHRPFLSALPREALANPRGPLAVLGHVDLAWSYAFQDPATGRGRASRFSEVIGSAVRGRRLGSAAWTLQRHALSASDVLAELEMRDAGSVERAQAWMERQDLRGYMLLGDPAARMAVGM